VSAEYDDWIGYFYDNWNDFVVGMGWFDNYLVNARTEYNANEDHDAIGFILNALDLFDASRILLFKRQDLWNWPYYAVVKLFCMTNDRLDAVEAGAAYELTWEKILVAWKADDFAGRFWTIAFIDRMRELIWDEPFSISWASKPEDYK